MSTQTTDVARRDESQAPATNQQPTSVMDVFRSESFKQQVAAALPRHIGVDSMMRIALTEVRMNPGLQKCTPASFMGALLKAAQSGLRPGMFGEGWIVPRWNSKLGCNEAQFQPGYMGLAQLAYRSGEVAEIHAVAVYRADHFVYQLGSDPKIEHVPDMESDHRDEDIVAFYAVVKLVKGGTLMKVMPRRDVDAIRDRFAPRNKAGKLVGPWTSDYEPMGCKTALIQCLKLAPKESERLQMALQAENDAIFGDRVAAHVVDTGTGKAVADRVAERIGVQVDQDTGEVVDGEVIEDAASPAMSSESAPEPPQATTEPSTPPVSGNGDPGAEEDPSAFWPTEEEPPGMDADEFKASHPRSAAEAGQRAAETAAKARAERPITAKQVNLVHAQCTIHGVDEDADLTPWLGDNIGVQSISEIPAVRLDEALEWIKSHEKGAAS